MVQLRGVSENPDTGQYSIVTEFVHGDNLFNLLRKKKLNKIQIREILLGISNGMMHLHKEGVVHRDLAARNILISEKDLAPKIRLATKIFFFFFGEKILFIIISFL